MTTTADKIEAEFRPATMLELLLRIDLPGMEKKIYEWAADDSPSAMPFRHRREPFQMMLAAIKREKQYRKLKNHDHNSGQDTTA